MRSHPAMATLREALVLRFSEPRRHLSGTNIAEHLGIPLDALHRALAPLETDAVGHILRVWNRTLPSEDWTIELPEPTLKRLLEVIERDVKNELLPGDILDRPLA